MKKGLKEKIADLLIKKVIWKQKDKEPVGFASAFLKEFGSLLSKKPYFSKRMHYLETRKKLEAEMQAKKDLGLLP